MITAEVLPATQGLDNLRVAWERLFGETGREPSLSWAWSRAIVRNHMAGNADWFTIVLRRDREPAAIIPMATLRHRTLGAEVVTLQLLQERNNTHTDVLVGADPALLDAWLGELERLPLRWDVLALPRVLEGSPLLAALESALRRRGANWRARPEQPSYYLHLPEAYEEYLAARSAKFRNHLKRAEKKLDTMGAVSFEVLGGDADVGARYEEMLTIERGSWKHAHGTAISAVAHQSGFYRDLCAGAREAGMLHLSFLRLDGVPLAYNLGVLVGGRYYYLKTSYLESWRAHGVASIGRARLIRHLIEGGCREFDFPAEPYEWEKQWSDEVRWHRSLFVFRKGLRGSLISLALRLRERLRGRGGDAREIVYSNARELRAPGSA
jgi:CelD/BcsL family acetyltransferase involved in cellulose biosynthesis